MKDVKMTNVCTGKWYNYLYVLVDKLTIRKQHTPWLKRHCGIFKGM